MKRLTGQWVRKAEGDWIIARDAARSRQPVKDAICFHCQQSAEKYLKALLQELGHPVGRTHDLEALYIDLLPHHAGLRGLRRGLSFLTDYAVEPRYPGKNATKRQMTAALRWAERVRETCRSLLRIHTGRNRSP